MAAGFTHPCHKNAPPPPQGARLLRTDKLYPEKNDLFRCTAPPPTPLAILSCIEHAINDSEDKPLDDIAPPEASDTQDSISVYCNCATTRDPVMRTAPPSATEVHQEKLEWDTETSKTSPLKTELESAKTAPPAPTVLH